MSYIAGMILILSLCNLIYKLRIVVNICGSAFRDVSYFRAHSSDEQMTYDLLIGDASRENRKVNN